LYNLEQDRPTPAQVPALLYLVQNNLQYVAVGYLDAATYTVSYQSKIIWSGILSVVLLGRKLGAHKWLGIALLAIGVAAVQLAGQKQSEASGDADSAAGKSVGLVAIARDRVAFRRRCLGARRGAASAFRQWVLGARRRALHGGAASTRVEEQFIQCRADSAEVAPAQVLAAMVSALAGVYFEKILKGAKVGLWTRNLQLAGYSVLVGYGKLAASPQGAALRAGQTSFFFGYTPMTWVCVTMNAFGGLLVGTVIKHRSRAGPDEWAATRRAPRKGSRNAASPGTRTRS